MIFRAFHATATPEGADAYREHFTRSVLPGLQRIDGYRGAYLLRRDHHGHVELQVLTLWDSLEAIRRFAGANLEHAVVDELLEHDARRQQRPARMPRGTAARARRSTDRRQVAVRATTPRWPGSAG